MGEHISLDSSIASLDDQIKELQLKKLEREIRHLRGLTFETLAKLSVAVLGIVAAAWAVSSGSIKAQLDLLDAREKLVLKIAEIDNKTKELSDLDSRKSLLADEYSRLQGTLRQFKENTQKVPPTAFGKGDQTLKQQLSEATKPIVFVQFAGSLSRDANIKPLLQALNDSGFNAPGAQRINKSQTNEVRYFANTEFERTTAHKIADIAKENFVKLGCPLPAMAVKLVERSDGKRSPPELWLMHSCDAKA